MGSCHRCSMLLPQAAGHALQPNRQMQRATMAVAAKILSGSATRARFTSVLLRNLPQLLQDPRARGWGMKLSSPSPSALLAACRVQTTGHWQARLPVCHSLFTGHLQNARPILEASASTMLLPRSSVATTNGTGKPLPKSGEYLSRYEEP